MGQITRKALVLFVLMGLFAIAAEDKNKARAEWMGGFVKMESADKVVSENGVAALALYKEALEVFEGVRRKYPQWNPSLLNYRINYCQQQIHELERKMASQANSLSSDELLELTNRQKQQLQELEGAKKELTARVEFLQDSLLRAREEASKSSSLESTATNLAEAKANLEKQVATLEVRLKSAENSLVDLKERSAGAEKLRRELEKSQQRLAEQEKELKKQEGDLKESKKEAERLKRELKLMTNNKEDVDVALKTASELATARKEEIAALQKNLKISEEKIGLKEKSISELKGEMEKLRKELGMRQAENDELKRLRKNDAASLDEYRKGKDLSDAIARDNAKLKEELLVLNGRNAKTESELRDKADELEKLRKELGKERTTTLAKEERIVELMSEISRLKQHNQQAEAQALKLSAELQEAKLMQTQRNDEMKGIVAKANESDELRIKLVELEQKLKGQIELSRQQEEQIARQTKNADENVRKQEESRLRIEAGRKELEQKLQEQAELAQKLEQQIARQAKEAEERDRSLEESRRRLEAGQKKLDDRQKELEASQKELDVARQEKEEGVRELAGLREKLTKANQDVDMLRQKITDMEVAALHKNSEHTEQTRKLKEELTSLTANSKNETERLVSKLAEANLNLKSLQNDLEKAKSSAELRLEMAAKNLEASQLEAQGLRRDVDANQEKYNKVVQELSAKLQTQNQEIDRLTVKCASFERKLSDDEKRHREEASELGRKADTELQRLQEQREETRRAQDESLKLKGELAAVQKRVEGMELEKQGLQGKIADMGEQIKLLKAQTEVVEGISLNLKEAEGKIKDLEAEKAKLEGEVAGKERQAGNAAKSMAEKEDYYRRQLAEKDDMIAKLTTGVRVETEKRIKSLEDEKASQEQQATQLAKAMAEKDEAYKRQLREKDETIARITTSNRQEAEERIKAFEAEKAKLTQESSNKERLADNAAKIMQEKENFYKTQLREKDEMISRLTASAENTQIWLTKIKQLNEKLDSESKRRMAVEAALVDMEDKLRAQESKTKEALDKSAADQRQVALVSGSSQGNEAELNISREQQRRTVINGFLRQGTESERQKRIEAARYNYQKALELDPDNVIALQRMGIIAATLGNDSEAVKYLKQAFKYDTDNLDTLLALGYAQARLGQPHWAVSYLGRAVALNPDNAYASRTYGAALFNMGWTDAAAVQLSQAHRLKPDDPEAPFNLAVLYATAKEPDYQEAAKWYKIAIKNGAQHDPGLDKVLQ